MDFLDFFFPKFCVQCKKQGSYVCADCFARIGFIASTRCLMCGKGAFGGITHAGCLSPSSIDGVFASTMYVGVIKKLLYQFKYNPYLSDLQTVLVDLLYEGLIQQEACIMALENQSVLVPIPLHAAKQRMRGYNHAEILSKNLGERLNLYTINALKRIKETTPQSNLSKSERQANITGCFAVQERFQKVIKGHTVFLIDDIVTSGATFREAAKMLKSGGAQKVFGVAVAHAELVM